jgi:ankyrin repeat protein
MLQAMALDLARNGEIEALEAMVAAGLPVNLADHKGNTLLMLACYHGHAACAAMLLARGAEVDRRNARGQTPLGGAAFKGYVEIVRLLVAHGADLDADNGAGATPVMFAAMFGRHAVVDELIATQRSRLGLGARMLVGWSRLWRKIRSGGRPTAVSN